MQVRFARIREGLRRTRAAAGVLGHAKPKITAALIIAGAAYAGAAMTFLIQLTLARGLGAAEFGVFVTALASVNVLAPLATFGLSGLLLRVFGEDHESARAWVRPVLKVAVFASALVTTIWCCWGLLQGSSVPLIAGLALYLLGQVMIDFDVSASQLRDRHVRVALLQFCPPLLRLLAVGCALALLGSFGSDAAALSFGLVGLVHAAAAAPIIKMLASVGTPRDAATSAFEPSIGRVVSTTGPYGLIAFLYMTYSQIPIVVANHVLGPVAAGRYGVVMVVLAVAYLLPSAVTQKFLLRRIHVWLVHDKPRIVRLYKQLLPWSFGTGVLAAVALGVAAPLLIPILFGEDLATDRLSLFVILTGLPFRFASIGLSVLLVGRTGIYHQIACLFLAASCNIVLGLILGSNFGFIGLGVAILVTEVVLFLSSWLAIQHSVIRFVGSEAQ